MKPKGILFCLLLLLIVPPAWAQKTGNAASGDGLEGFALPTQRLNPSLHFQQGAPADDLTAWVRNQFPEYFQYGHDLRLLRSKSSPGGQHLTFQHKFKGFPVFHSTLNFHFAPDGECLSVLKELANPVSFPGNRFLLESEVAVQKMQERWGFGDEVRFESEQGWLFFENELTAVYQVKSRGKTFGTHLTAFVDGETGEMLAWFDHSSYHRPAPPPRDTTGHGYVFHPDPITKDQTFYGSSWQYTDTSDQVTPALDYARIPVELREIEFDSGVFHLSGPYVELLNIEAPNLPPVTSANGNFYAQRSDQDFEEVMCYFYMDTVQRHIQALGFTNLQETPLAVDAHGLSGTDNSHFVPSNSLGRPYCAFGDGGVDDAEDADVVIHEYAHAVSEAATGGTNIQFERRGLDEGVGDYFAASWSYAINPYRWQDIFPWDGHNEFWPGRSADVNYAYPPANSAGNYYAFGELWATVLMRALQDPQIGREVSDRLVLESLYYHTSNTSLEQAALNILDADQALYFGAHYTLYRDYFCAAGILQGAVCSSVSREDDLARPNLNLFPNPVHSTLVVDCQGFVGEAEFVLMDVQGRVMQSGMLSPGKRELDVSDMASGMYLFQVQVPGMVPVTKKILIQ